MEAEFCNSRRHRGLGALSWRNGSRTALFLGARNGSAGDLAGSALLPLVPSLHEVF